MRRFVVIPLIVNAMLFASLVYLLFLGTEELGAMLEGWLPDILDWLKYLLWPIFLISAALIVVFGFTLAGNLISAPFNGFLAEAVERRLTGQALRSSPGWPALAAEIKRSLLSECRKLLYTAVRAIPILILLWVPLINVPASVLWLVLGAWLMSLQYADYPMANHGLGFPEQRALLARHRLLSLSFGASIMLALMVPVLNFVVIPASVAGATVMWVERLRGDTDHAR